MEKLTSKEEEVLEYIWQMGKACAPKDVVECYPEPQPHVNTVSTSFQSLERKGYLKHETHGRGYLYLPIVPKEKYRSKKMRGIVSRLFSGSYLDVVSAFVQDKHVSRDELLALIDELENKK